MNLKLGRLDVPARGMVFHYYRTAKSSQRDQLRMIRDLGFDVIHTEESPVAPGKYRGSLAPVMAWNHIETGKNQYDWGFLDQLVEDCDAVGLQVLHDICLVAHLPEWVAQENAGTEIVYPTGEIVGPWQRGDFCHVQYQMRSFSLAHPACRAAAADFLGKVAARYAGSRRAGIHPGGGTLPQFPAHEDLVRAGRLAGHGRGLYRLPPGEVRQGGRDERRLRRVVSRFPLGRVRPWAVQACAAN